MEQAHARTATREPWPSSVAWKNNDLASKCHQHTAKLSYKAGSWLMLNRAIKQTLVEEDHPWCRRREGEEGYKKTGKHTSINEVPIAVLCSMQDCQGHILLIDFRVVQIKWNITSAEWSLVRMQPWCCSRIASFATKFHWEAHADINYIFLTFWPYKTWHLSGFGSECKVLFLVRPPGNSVWAVLCKCCSVSAAGIS